MPTSPLPSPEIASDALCTPAQLAQIKTHALYLAERLQAATRETLQELPITKRNATELARHLDIERTVCQRLISSVCTGTLAPDTLIKIPGPKALRVLIEALETRDYKSAALLNSAVQQIEEFFARTGGSQRGFSRLLFDTSQHLLSTLTPESLHLKSPAPNPIDALAPRAAPSAIPQTIFSVASIEADLLQRQQLFSIARNMSRESMRTNVKLGILYPSPDNPATFDYAQIRGFVARQAAPNALPIVIGLNAKAASSAADAHRAPRSTFKSGLVPEFCTHPLPTLTQIPAIPSEARYSPYILEHPLSSPTNDTFFADQKLELHPNPETYETFADEFWSAINMPCEHMVMTIYQPRSLAQRCTPGIDVHLLNPGIADAQNLRWTSKLPIQPELTILGSGLAQAHATHYPRHAELTQHLFKSLNLNPADFVGYRCERAYPEWRTSYRMFFDFSHRDEST